MQLYFYKDIEANSVDELIATLSDIAGKLCGFEREKISSNLSERERISPTTIGRGVMLPHIRLEGIEEDYLIFLRLKKAFKYTSPDNKDVYLIFFILSPIERKTEYLKLLSLIVKMVKRDDILEILSSEQDEENVKRIILQNLSLRGLGG